MPPEGGRVVAVLERGPAGLAPVSLELAAGAKLLAEWLGLEARLVVLGDQPEELARQAAASGLPVMAVRVPGLTGFSGEVYRQVLAELLPRWRTAVLLAGHTTSGLDWLPGLAGRLDAACVSGVEGMRLAEGRLVLRRATMHGKLVEEIAPRAWPLCLTLQPGALASRVTTGNAPGAVEIIETAQPELRTKVEDLPGEANADAALSQAQVVVAAGLGVGGPENLELLRRLAARFPNSALAGSRPVCDLGWLPYRQQVGLTGATVNPRLYIACGISGARQHTVGMQGSGFIVAISHDPQAAIFNLADVCVVDDLPAFLQAFLDLI
ncbi:MAG: electron transfer flavoprotein subunit alpha/FixB family protein [Desulfarculus sp.]|nr:electron transfer flavoprotein subunit alpha/FixB family protein [Desulfarculus sp.]